MTGIKLPIGIDSFEKLRTQGFYYVDKTLLIRDLLNGWGEVNLFTRPRRFGKTLNMSMLKSFFEIGCDKSLFKGLDISGEKDLCEKYMGKYPVIFLSLKNVDGLTFNDAYESLRLTIRKEVSRLNFLSCGDGVPEDDRRAFERFRKEEETRTDVYDSLCMLTRIMAKHYGQKTILLIDEYDVPLDKSYRHGYYDEMINLVRGMFGSALKTNDSLYFAVLSGCLRVSKESIFTGLNNLKVHSITDARFDEFFGFSDSEVRTMLNEYGLIGHLPEIKQWYDGYRFGERDVYCPWDVINYLYDLLASEKAKPKAYWMNTSGNDMVRRLIDKADTGTAKMDIERLIRGESIKKIINEKLTHNEIDSDVNNLWSLLLMTGYLTVVRQPDDDLYELTIPNKEVRKIYVDQVRQWFSDKAKSESKALQGLFKAFENGDAAFVEDILNSLLITTISFHDARESFYHGFLLALMNTCAKWRVTSNSETGKGRSDILVERTDATIGFVVEIKSVKDIKEMSNACQSAIRQIEEKDYAAILREYRVKSILIYGMAFCKKECKVSVRRIS